MGIFKRRKKEGSSYTFQLLSSLNQIFSSFGSNINKSDVVKICIDRIASQCAKLKPRYIKTLDDKTVTEKSGKLSFILKYKPNPLMTPYDFIYKVVTLLMQNDNAFIYPMYDKLNKNLIALYPLRPSLVEIEVDNLDNYYLKFLFDDGRSFILPYENVIHLKRFYGSNDLLGGSGFSSDHDAILKTIKINELVLQGIENAVKSSLQIKGIIKMNGMLSETDKKKQRKLFDNALNDAVSSRGSSIIPVDLKNDYIPIEIDPKLIDKDTLEFLQSKILDYFGVSIPIFTNNYDEDEFISFYESTIEPLAIQGVVFVRYQTNLMLQ